MSAEDTGLREAVERLADEWEASAPKLVDGPRFPVWAIPIRDAYTALRALLAEHQPTAREGEEFYCEICGSDGHDALGHGDDHAQPAPVAPAGEVGLSEEERGQILDAVLDDRSRAEGYTVLGPGGTDGQTPTVYEAVERILAARLAAAEQRVTEAKAEALREAADVGLAEAYGAGAIDNDAARWLRDRAADIRREATGEGGGA